MSWDMDLVKQNPRMAMVCSVGLISVLLLSTVLFALVGGSSDGSQTPNNISAHVLDIGRGRPAVGVNCTCFKLLNADGEEPSTKEEWISVGTTVTDGQGRISVAHPAEKLSPGIYKLRFNTKAYFEELKERTFYPHIEVIFVVEDASQHYHVPITLSNFGYSTYKGQ